MGIIIFLGIAALVIPLVAGVIFVVAASVWKALVGSWDNDGNGD